MIQITRERIIQAFKNKERKRNSLLYDYYKLTVFDKDYSAFVMAEMISQDLGLTITPHMIYNINKRIINPHKKGSGFTTPDHSQLVTNKIAENEIDFDNSLSNPLDLLQTVPTRQQIEALSEKQFHRLIHSDQITISQLEHIDLLVTDPGRKSQLTARLKDITRNTTDLQEDLPNAGTQKNAGPVIPKNKYQNAEDETRKNPFLDLMKGL